MRATRVDTAPVSVARPRRRRVRASTVRAIIASLILIPIGVLWIYPLLWMVSASLKTNKEIFSGLGLIPAEPQWQNYVRAWEEAREPRQDQRLGRLVGGRHRRCIRLVMDRKAEVADPQDLLAGCERGIEHVVEHVVEQGHGTPRRPRRRACMPAPGLQAVRGLPRSAVRLCRIRA